MERRVQAARKQAVRQQKKQQRKNQLQRIIQKIQQRKTPVSTATEATKSSTEEVSTASKKDEQAKPKTATGTYNGFADTNSVEIELSNGNFETFLVNDDDVKTALSKKSEGSKITFTYGAVEGQANKEILSVK